MVRFRSSKQLNRIKEYSAKLDAFLELQAKCTADLKEGWNPLGEPKVEVRTLIKPTMLVDAIQYFLEYHKSKGNRLKTIQSYRSKLRLLVEHLGNLKVSEINDYHITDFLNTCERERQWTSGMNKYQDTKSISQYLSNK